jgi:hypothetical protein
MKTAKLMLMIAFLAFGTMLITNAAPDSPIVKLKITEVYNYRGLEKAMHTQLDLNDILRMENNGLYSARVTLKNVVYEIWGTRSQWVEFFIGHDPDSPSIGIELPPDA